MAFDVDRPDLTVGIVGMGTMGRGIAQLAASAGLCVLAIDTRPGAASEAKRQIAKALGRFVEKGRMTLEDADAAVCRIEIAEQLTQLVDCDVVIEAIVEQLAVKQELFVELDEIVPDDRILATNTSSLPVTAIAARCARPQRVAGLHFFNPAPLMKLVEVIPGLKTAPQIVESLAALGRRMGRQPVLVKDSPGFLVNHVGRAYMPESLRVLAERIAEPQDIDRVLREAAGFRMGPFELLDLVGLDVAHPVMESMYAQYYQEPMYQPSTITRLRLAAGMLGQKSGSGFFSYEAGKAMLPPELALPEARPTSVWVSPEDSDGYRVMTEMLAATKVTLETSPRPGPDALCIVTPLGEDASTAAMRQRLDPTRTVAVDTILPLDRRRTVMTTPVTHAQYRQAAHGLLGADGVAVTVISDSPGFIAQRVLAMIVNVGANIAQLQIAAPADIDAAARLGLNYPFGPLEFGDRIGPRRIVAILEAMHAFYGEPRYRPTPWLKRRALLGVSLLTVETTS
jgi:3-hydroxybutyryl-CoA dehydrogenase